MVKVTDAAMIRKAIEDMPYLDWTTECEETDEIIPLTLRQFYEGTWQGAYADELFTAVERVIAEVLTSVTVSTYQRGKLEGARLALEAAADWFAERFSEAVQSDCENGVKWLNERAAKAYLQEAPDTLAAIREGEDAIRALDPAKIVGEG